jgi:hypothetical protein
MVSGNPKGPKSSYNCTGNILSLRPNQLLTTTQIRDMVNSDNNQDLEILAQRIAHRGAVLPGTRPYWSDASQKLKTQICDPNCKSPYLFYCCSL